ncbi:patatin-like phospholipase family protein [Mesotoga sp. H07.pep.5.3]|uniref:patatin-like phospholipase family protein n=1 Tax=Mesotoga sp. H07.pep.5.3 TaxID=1421003 RepID=UPI000C18C7E5|nr:patatin-like phospholipase family protein [Mesotoga sp. H07.pep.5.3]PIJ60966.1 Patatin [Mesotoga sp. H07.pep.5.3]
MRSLAVALFILAPLIMLSGSVALVLSGGGAKGGYEIGAWKALIDLGVDLGGVYGTSVGSLNAAAVAQGDFDKALDVWRNISEESVMKPTEAQRKLIEAYGGGSDWSLGELYQGAVDVINEGIDVTPLKELLSSVISEEAVRNSSMDFGLVTFDLTDVRPEMLFIEDIPQGSLVDYLMASANFPGFRTVVIDGKAFVDGGIYSNQPVEMALERGFREIILVDIGRTALRDRIGKFQAYLSGAKLTHIRPRVMYGSTLDFDSEKAILQIEAGYLDTLAAFGLTKGKYTYIFENRDVFKMMFDSLSPEEKNEAMKIVNDSREWEDPESFYSELLSSLERIYESEDPMIDVVDELASMLEVPALDLYSVEEILQALRGAYLNKGFLDEEVSPVHLRKMLSFFIFLCEKAEIPEPPAQFDLFKSSFMTLRGVEE